MTRPKADTDPWLTDPVSRDRVIAKTVVSGMRTIIGLLRDIRDAQIETQRALMAENTRLRDELYEAHRGTPATPVRTSGSFDVPPCEKAGCALPLGHLEAHRGSLRRAG